MIDSTQSTFVGGSVVMVRKVNADYTPAGAWIDLGTIDPVAPTYTRNQVELKDARKGVAEVVATRTIESVTEFTVKTYNLSPQNWAYVLGDANVATFTQTALVSSSNLHENVYPMSIIPLRNASGGQRIIHVTNIDSVVFGSDTLTVGEDYIVTDEMLQAGLIKLLAPAGFPTDGTGDITVTLDADAATGVRLIAPGDSYETLVEMMVLQTEGGGGNGLIQEGMIVKLRGTSVELPQNNWGSVTLTGKVISRTDTGNSLGTALFLGTLPPTTA